jgi:hypothetical protein
MNVPALTTADIPAQIASARAAYEKAPNALAPSTALTQALLDANKAAATCDIAKRTAAPHPHALSTMEKLAPAAILSFPITQTFFFLSTRLKHV